MACAAVVYAVWKPKLCPMKGMSLSMVLGIPMTAIGSPRSCSTSASGSVLGTRERAGPGADGRPARRAGRRHPLRHRRRRVDARAAGHDVVDAVVGVQLQHETTHDVVEARAEPAAGDDGGPGRARLEEQPATGSAGFEGGQLAPRQVAPPQQLEGVVEEDPVVLVDVVLVRPPPGDVLAERRVERALTQAGHAGRAAWSCRQGPPAMCQPCCRRATPPGPARVTPRRRRPPSRSPGAGDVRHRCRRTPFARHRWRARCREPP